MVREYPVGSARALFNSNSLYPLVKFMKNLWTDAAKERDKYHQFYEYYKQQIENPNGK
jgi:hypothetical protein